MHNPVIIWFVIGAALMLLEFALPGLILIFFGIAAWVVSLAQYLGLIDGLTAQCLVFSVATILCLALLRKYVKSWFVGDSRDEDDEFHSEFVGQLVRVTRAIPSGPGRGKIELKGAEWNAFSDAAHEVGDMVTVIGRDGLNLTVATKG